MRSVTSRRVGQPLLALSSISVVLWLSIVSGCMKHVKASPSSRCDLLCSLDGLREQCDRCKLRVPMRFGKRSSPPEYLLELRKVGANDRQSIPTLKSDDEEDDDDRLASDIFEYLTAPQQRRVSPVLRRKRTLESSSTTRLSIPFANQDTKKNGLWQRLFRSFADSSNKILHSQPIS